MDLFTNDMQPFNILEDRGFRNFVKILNSSYHLPSRKYVSNTLLPALYKEKYNYVENVVKNIQQNVTLTTDCWTSRNTQKFYGSNNPFCEGRLSGEIGIARMLFFTN